jgi:hypothetical protein
LLFFLLCLPPTVPCPAKEDILKISNINATIQNDRCPFVLGDKCPRLRFFFTWSQ